jgi:hypothetical protein
MHAAQLKYQQIRALSAGTKTCSRFRAPETRSELSRNWGRILRQFIALDFDWLSSNYGYQQMKGDLRVVSHHNARLYIDNSMMNCIGQVSCVEHADHLRNTMTLWRSLQQTTKVGKQTKLAVSRAFGDSLISS